MKINDALKILKLETTALTQEQIKKAYREACKLYHPDLGGSAEMMQAVNAAYEALKDYQGETVSNDDLEYPEALNNALNSIISLDGIIIEICGAWIWVTGNTRDHKDTLKLNGFKWANKKKAWYFRPSDYKSSSRGSMSLDEIRVRHNSSIIKGNKKLFINQERR